MLVAGTLFGHYEIASLLGAGGIGEVYLAKDVQLGRPVALKLLRPELVGSREHLRRFEQEARAISALNHPNILTIYEVGQVDCVNFIATEFINGQTLRQVIDSRRMTASEVLETASQIASGLEAAHAAGVVHRDIKPENLMLRPDGYVKILDFGLAKLVADMSEQCPAIIGDSTVSNLNTADGVIMGTIAYMSPEQLRGQKVDARADLWSLGIVLYESLAGRPPFEGMSSVDVIASILEREPPALTQCSPEYPLKLESIILGLLAKERELRYQTAKDLLLDLHQLEPELGTGGRPGSLLSLNDSTLLTRVKPARRRDTDQSTTRATFAEPPSVGRLLRHRWRSAALVALALLALGVNLFFITRRQSRSALALNDEPAPFSAVKLTKFINTGNAVDAVVSPDGKYVAYVQEDSGRQSLSVRQVVAASKLQLIPLEEVRYYGLTFSPDSNFIFYIRFEKNKNLGGLYQIPVLGGTARKVLEDVDTPVSFSPDGRHFAFVRGFPSMKETALMVGDADGSNVRRLATRKSPDDFGWQGGPAWSPDGTMVACAVGTYELTMGVVSVRIADGAQNYLSKERWSAIGRIAWLKDGGLLMSAKEQGSSLLQLWLISLPGGEARRVTNDLNNYNLRAVSVTRDSSHVIAVQTGYLSSIWVLPKGDVGRARPIATGKSDGLGGLAWTPDRRIVFVSNANGSQDIWIMDADGSNQKQLTTGGSLKLHPNVTPDGRYIVFVSNHEGAQDIWRMNIDGSQPKQLTHGWNAGWLDCSPDGRWIVFKSYGAGRRNLWKISIDGGEPVQVTDRYAGWPAVSPKGDLIACEYWEEQADSNFSLGLLPFNGGPPVKVLKFPPSAPKHLSSQIRWSADGSAVEYVGNGKVSNIWSLPIDGGSPRQLTSFKDGRIFWFDWSRVDRTLVCARGESTSDVVLISNFSSDRQSANDTERQH